MGNQKKSHKRQERAGRRPSRDSGLTKVLYGFLAVVAALAALVVQQTFFSGKVPGESINV